MPSIADDLVALMQKQEEFYLHLELVSLEDIENNLEFLKTPLNQDAHAFDTFVKEQATISKINTLSTTALGSVQYKIKKSNALSILQQVNKQQTQLARFLELKEMLTQIIDHSVLKPESIVKLTLTEVNLVWIQDFNIILTILDHLKHRPHWQVTGKVLPNVELLCKYGLDKLCSYFDIHLNYIKEHPNTNILIRHQKLKVCAPAIKMLKKTYPDTYTKIRQEYVTIVENYYFKLFSEYISSLKQSCIPDPDIMPFTDWLKPCQNTPSFYYIDNIDELLKPEKHVVFMSPNHKISPIKVAQGLLKVLVDTWSSERSFLLDFFHLSTMSISKKEPRHPDFDVFKSTHQLVFTTLHSMLVKSSLTNSMVLLQTMTYLGNSTPISKQELRLSNLQIETSTIVRQYLKDLILYLENNTKKNVKQQNQAEYNILQTLQPKDVVLLQGSRCMLDIFSMSIHINAHGVIFTELWDMIFTSYNAYIACLQGYSRQHSTTILHYHSIILKNMYVIDVGIRGLLDKFELPQKERHYKLFDSLVDGFCKDMLRYAFPGLMNVLDEFTLDQVEKPSQDLLEQTSEEFSNLWRSMLQDIMYAIPMSFEHSELVNYLQKKTSEFFIVTYSSYLTLLDRVFFDENKTSTVNSNKRYPFKRQPHPIQALLAELKKYNLQ
eukprot:NODE_38_length_30618_cov_0.377142.p1 type:complete len:663 gc:universal NODE_38_length_30618_cov_0.377142:3731-1743(-)